MLKILMRLKCNTRGNGNARRDALKHFTYHTCKSTDLQLLQTKHCVVRPLLTFRNCNAELFCSQTVGIDVIVTFPQQS